MNDLELEIRRLNTELNEQKARVDSLQTTLDELRRLSPESHGTLVYIFKMYIVMRYTLFVFKLLLNATKYFPIFSPADLWGILSGPGNRVQTFFLD